MTDTFQNCQVLSGENNLVEEVSTEAPPLEGMEKDQMYMRPSPTVMNEPYLQQLHHKTDTSTNLTCSLNTGDRIDVLVKHE